MSDFPNDDQNNPQPDAGNDSPDQSQPVSNTPAPAATPTTAPTTPTTATAASQPPQQSQAAPQPSQASQPASQPKANGAVSNAPAVHPSVAKASVLRQVALALSGGPRWTTSIDPQTGAATRTQVPVSGRDIGFAIAMEALSGGIAGFSATGPGATGRAAVAGFNQVSAQQRQAQQDQAAQAQQDAENQSQALVRKAQAFENNQRNILNTAQVERYGIESLKDSVATNAALLKGYDDQGAVSESSISQDALTAGIASGKYNATAQIAVPDGFTNVSGKYEQTFSIIDNPSAKVSLTNEQAKIFADGSVPGWAAFTTSKLPPDFTITGTMLANANAQLQAIKLMKSDIGQVSDTLAKSDDPATKELAKSIPNISDMLNDKTTGPVLASALLKSQKYVSHAGLSHDNDLYHSLLQMAAPTKPDPSNPKMTITNTDGAAAQIIAGAIGGNNPQKGWAILKAYSQQIAPEPIKSPEEAVSIATDPTSTPRDVRRAQAFLAASNQQAAAVAGADAKARNAAKGAGTGTGVPSGDVQQAADAIASGKGTFEQLTSGMGKEASAFRRSVESDLLRRYPNVNVAALKAYSKAADSQGVQSQVTNARSLFGANGQPGSFDNLEDTIRSVPKARFPILSALGQKTAYQLGSPQMATLIAVKTDIASDLAKFNSGGGSHSSDHQIELYREQLNSAQTPEQVDAVLKDLRAISSKRLTGLVGTNPYLANMTGDINDPVTKQPRGSAGVSVPQSNAPIAPAGATMKVPGSDGRLHWSDGKQDLGVAQ